MISTLYIVAQNEAAGTITDTIRTMPPPLGTGRVYGRAEKTSLNLEIRVLYSEIVEGAREFDGGGDIAVLDD